MQKNWQGRPMRRWLGIALLLTLTLPIGWSQTVGSTPLRSASRLMPVGDCESACEAEINRVVMQMLTVAKVERDKAVAQAVATERRHYEPRLARQTSLANDWKNEAKRSQGESLLAWIVTGVVGVLALIGFVT